MSDRMPPVTRDLASKAVGGGVPATSACLRLQGVSKRFGSVAAVKGLTLEVLEGEFFVLLGPSGCGKTTTLRMLAGLEQPDEGEIWLGEQCLASPSRAIRLPAWKRNMGMVFQSYAIWPHMTVFENVAYGLQLRRQSASVQKQRVREVLELVGLEGFEDRPAPLLSGGQQQRVAVARALVYSPQVLLLDEPLSNLDARLRDQMRVELKLLQRRLGITVVYVTHDQVEALSLADRIGVMDHGRLEQVGTPEETYTMPRTPFVNKFLGKVCLWQGQITEARQDGCVVALKERGAPVVLVKCGLRMGSGADAGAACRTCASSSPGTGVPVADGQVKTPSVSVVVRPEHVRVWRAPPEGRSNVVPGVIEQVQFLGDRCEYLGRVGGASVIIPLAGRRVLEPGDPFFLELPPEELVLWPAHEQVLSLTPPGDIGEAM